MHPAPATSPRPRLAAHLLLLRLRHGPAPRTLAHRGVVHPALDDRLELRAEVRAVERLLADHRRRRVCPRRLAVPAQAVYVRAVASAAAADSARSGTEVRTDGALWAHALNDDPDSVREAHRVVRCVCWCQRGVSPLCDSTEAGAYLEARTSRPPQSEYP